MNAEKFVYAIFIKTTPEKLWEALTKSEFTHQFWWGENLESDWRVGSPVKGFTDDGESNFEGEILRAEPPRLLSYSFLDTQTEESRKGKPSRVTFEIEPLQGVVKLTVTHDELTDAKSAQGWEAVVSSLKTLLETGKALPDWD